MAFHLPWAASGRKSADAGSLPFFLPGTLALVSRKCSTPQKIGLKFHNTSNAPGRMRSQGEQNS